MGGPQTDRSDLSSSSSGFTNWWLVTHHKSSPTRVGHKLMDDRRALLKNREATQTGKVNLK